MRMHMKRYARRTNAHSKKFENHVNNLSLFFLWYNFVRIHQRICCTRPMKDGLTDTLYELDWPARMIDEYG